jgi:oligosaccharide repeat unit polymerase
MSSALEKSTVSLGIFGLGASYFLYSFMQFFFTPVIFYICQNSNSFKWMYELFDIFEAAGQTLFNFQSILYSFFGITFFFVGYFLCPNELGQISNKVIYRRWNSARAEKIFWILIVSGSLLKVIKILSGVSVNDVVSANIVHSYFSDPLLIFFLSFNWFNLIALMVINVAYQEAEAENLPSSKRLKWLAYSYSIIYLLISLSTGSRSATLFPMIGVIIIYQYYLKKQIPFFKLSAYCVLLITFIFCMKLLLAQYFEIEGAEESADLGLSHAFFYVIFFRVNMSYVLWAVIDGGQNAFPNGTLMQFFIDLTPYLMERVNVFDGNEFGRALGLAGQNDFVTGVASTNMGEWFINFGLPGIIFGMLLTGVIYKIIYSNCQQRFPFFVMSYALLWPILIHGMESPVSVLYATLIKMICFCFFVHLAITYRFSKV